MVTTCKISYYESRLAATIPDLHASCRNFKKIFLPSRRHRSSGLFILPETDVSRIIFLNIIFVLRKFYEENVHCTTKKWISTVVYSSTFVDVWKPNKRSRRWWPWKLGQSVHSGMFFWREHGKGRKQCNVRIITRGDFGSPLWKVTCR